MPPARLFSVDDFDLDHPLYDHEQIYARFLPHRHEFALLGGILHFDLERQRIAAVAEVTQDEWWVRAHIPGRPLLPGVLMLEMAAQTASVGARLVRESAGRTEEAFFGFGGVDACKFRDSVSPPARFVVLCEGEENRPRRIISRTQGFVDDKLVFEARITGMRLS